MTRLTSISLAGTIGKNYYGIGRDPGVVTKTIGTASRDYSTIAAWEADLDNTGVYMTNDEAVGECYNDSSFTFSSAIAIDTNATLSSIKLTAPRSERHDGTAGTGARLIPATSLYANFCLRIEDPNVRVEFLEFEFDQQAGYDTSGIILPIGKSSTNCDVNGCLFHSLENGSVSPAVGVYVQSNVTDTRVHNNFFITMGYCIRSSYGGTAYLYNNTGYGSSTSGRSVVGIDYINYSTNVDLRSNIMANFGTADIDTGWTISPTTNATSDDSGQTTGITASDHFVSTVGGSEDLHLVKSSSLRGAGQDLGTSYGPDINDSNRYALSATVWDIGAHQYASTASIGTSGRDYSTITLWEADLDDTTIYGAGANSVGECYNDSVFTAGATINGGGTVGLGSVKLTSAIGQRHDGTQGTGVRFVSQADYSGVTGGASGLHVSFIEFDFNNYINIQMGGAGSTYSGLLIHKANMRSHIFYYDYSQMNIFNNIIYNGGGSRGKYVIRTTSSGLSYISNNTVYDVSGNSFAYYLRFGNTIGKNNIAVNVTSPGFAYSGSPTVSNNMSSDSSANVGADNITNVDLNTQFVSIIAGSEDLHLIGSSDAIKAGVDLGTTPEGIQYDIDNRARGSIWDIGADQTVSGHIRRALLHVG